ncbi:testis-specific Y-encoded-like protein 2 [Orycteropus afer afer]|uniref:Testis-specific Y-encoded-like protein 2 n=1 Tax=Orycteropus afer afer TaxID=1230840 RepID=A0AC54Z8M8_ORYAF|nr:testis-specific Y-encoded-like protein 2 [Orycteropus afer afer]
MNLLNEEPPAKNRRLSSPELPQHDLPPPPQLLQLPLPPPQQRPRLREETEAAQVLADMRGGRLGPALPPPPPFVILEEGGIRAYFTLGAGCPGWEPAIESGYGGTPSPTGGLETLSTSAASGGSLEIGFQVTGPSSFAGEKARKTCRARRRRSQRLAGPKKKEDAVIVVEDKYEREEEKRRQRKMKMKKESKERNAERMEALENIQLDLEAVNIKAGKAFLRLKRRFIQMRRPFLERRDLIIRHIPGFWVKAFLNHPKISILISQRDEDIFRYLTNLQVQDLRHISMGYKMKLYFQTNPYFTNMVIVKEFQHNCSGQLVSHSTPIRWHRGQEPQTHRHKNQNISRSFFNWFSSYSFPEADMIAEIIKNDLWVNPLRYYMMGEGGYRANGKKQKEESNTKDEYEVMILEDSDDEHQAMKDIISETSDSDATTDISESLCDNDTTDNNESSCDDTNGNNNKTPDGDDENLESGNQSNNSNIQGSSDSDNEEDTEDSDDEDNDGNEGDNESSDDGNEGDNEGSDDDDEDIEGYENGIEDPDKDHDNSSNQKDYEDDEVEDISEEESEEEDDKGNEEGSEQEGEDSDDEAGDEDSNMGEMLQTQNFWAHLGK